MGAGARCGAGTDVDIVVAGIGARVGTEVVETVG